jgi:hypothetical protein
VGRRSGRSSSSTLSIRTRFLSANERGLMLIDLLLGLALALLMIGILQQIAGLVFSGYVNSSDRAELQYSSRMALDCIQQDIRTARDFQTNADGSHLMISGSGGENILIFVGNGNLYRKYDSTVPVAENISKVNFIKSGSMLQCKLQLQNQEDGYEIEFFCFSRPLKAQE